MNEPIKINGFNNLATMIPNGLVFVASPWRPPTHSHIATYNQYIIDLCRDLATIGRFPFAPHLLYPQFLDDGVEIERKFGMACGFEILCKCDYLLAGIDHGISQGMQQEITVAQYKEIPVFLYQRT